jgi:hypothetical protein
MIRIPLLALLFVCASAAAQMRSIPGDAKRAEIRHVQDTVVELDGARARLAPGAQIRDAENRLVVPTAIPGGALVKYLLDAQGQVRRVWILSPAETAQGGRNWN